MVLKNTRFNRIIPMQLNRAFKGEIDKDWLVGFVKKIVQILCLILNA